MSNHLAIATVTATVRHILQRAADVDVPGTSVSTGRPDTLTDDGARINVYLYQVTPNAAWRNIDLPWRDSDANMTQRPRAALDLHYLLSFTGDETTLVPQRLLGSAVRSFVSLSALGREVIKVAAGDQILGGTLANSDLVDQPELVRIAPQPLSIEEMSKLWAVFPQTAYALSVAYQATVVLIDALDSPLPVRTVRFPNVVVQPIQYPSIDSIGSSGSRDATLDLNSTLVISGHNLNGATTGLLFGATGKAVPVLGSEIVGDDRLEIKLARLPAIMSLHAGPQTVQVVQQIMDDKHPNVAFESNVQTFVLRPLLKAAPVYRAGSKRITAQLQPNVSATQRVVLLLNTMSAGAKPVAYTINADPDRADDSDTVSFAVPNVTPGEYALRVQVDGAQTPCDVDPKTGSITGPIITIT